MGVCNKRQFTILVDLDDTMINLIDCWVAFINKQYHTTVNPEDITDWNITKFFPTLTKEQVFSPLFTDGFWSTVKPKEDAAKYLKMLKDDGYRVIICTNTNYKTLREKMEKVLFKYFDFISWNDVVIAYHKQLLNADFLIDDGVHNLVGGRYKGILMDAPHNKNFNEQEHGIIRVKTWSETYALIKDMTEKEEKF